MTNLLREAAFVLCSEIVHRLLERGLEPNEENSILFVHGLMIASAARACSVTLPPTSRGSFVAGLRLVLRLPTMVLLAETLEWPPEIPTSRQGDDVVRMAGRLTADDTIGVLVQLSIPESTPTLAPVKRAAVGMLRCILRPTVGLPRVSKAAGSTG